MAGKKKDLLICIDLGTSWTAVISSKGDRACFQSAVGYPKDIISAKVLDSQFVIGENAINKSYLNTCFPLKDGVIKETGDYDHEAAKKLISHALSLVKVGENDRLCALISVPAGASISNREIVLTLADEVFDIAMVISEPFVVGYGMDKLVNCLVVDIGAGTIDLCALKGTLPKPEHQACIQKAGEFVDNMLMDLLKANHPEIQINEIICREFKEQYGFVEDKSEAINVDVRENGKPIQIEIRKEMRESCRSIVPDMVEQIKKLIKGFAPEDQAPAVANIILAGGGSQISGLNKMLTTALAEYGDVKIYSVPDITYCGCEGSLKLATDVKPDFWDELAW